MTEIQGPSRKTEEAAVISAARGGRGAAPKAVTANRLSDGAVVYLGEDAQWTERISGALIAADKEAAGALLAKAEQDVRSCEVIAPYLIDVGQDPQGGVRPSTYRERIRAFGPSTHPQFGANEAG